MVHMTSRKDTEKSLVDFTDDVGYREGLSRMEQLDSLDGTPKL
jgi:hypothetical protein